MRGERGPETRRETGGGGEKGCEILNLHDLRADKLYARDRHICRRSSRASAPRQVVEMVTPGTKARRTTKSNMSLLDLRWAESSLH